MKYRRQLLPVILLLTLSCTKNDFIQRTSYSVMPQNAVAVVCADGHIASARTLPLFFSVKGHVHSIRAYAGQEVKKGDTLATIDARAARREVDRCRAALTDAQLHLEKVQTTDRVVAEQNLVKTRLRKDALGKQLEQSEELYRQDGLSSTDLVKIKNEYLTASADLAITEAHYTDITSTETKMHAAAVRTAEIALQGALSVFEEMVLTSPVDGLILKVAVSAGARSTPDVPAMVVYPLTSYRVIEVQVADEAVGRVKKGQRARLTLPGLPDVVWQATVSAVAAGATAEGSLVFITTDSLATTHLTAAQVSVTIYTDTITTALVLPVHYITFRDQTASVLVKQAGHAAAVTPIHCITTSDGRYIVDRGITAGDTILSP